MCAERMEENSIAPAYTDDLARLEGSFILEFLKKRGLTLAKLQALPRQTAIATMEKASSEFLRSLLSTKDHPIRR